ncbi:MAG: DUF1080 domain-containing protein [Planctomycetes bacterium]|nr:DUF1080 domain-containing protein [Planctomycetota bacterium]
MLPNRLILIAAVVAACATVLPAEDKKPVAPAGDFKPMFNGKNLDGWVNVNCAPDTFYVKGDEIITTGSPTGFLRTDRQYENFVMEFDWMHVEKEKMANSGLFVWGDPLPAVGTAYTRGIEVQVLINFAPKDGWATSHGDIFSIWGARCTPDRPHFKGIERCLPSENRVKGGGEWNHYKVTGNDGAIKLEVNGKEVSGVSKCNPRKGYLALESEGAECHFKNLKIKELPSTNPKPEEVAKVWEGHTSLFNGIALKGWKTEKDAWKVSGGVIRPTTKEVTAKETLETEKKYGKAELVFDWKMPAKGEGGFCGVDLGSFAVDMNAFGGSLVGWRDGDKFEGTRRGKDVDLKPGQWNRTVITVDGKKYSVTVNGKDAGAWEEKERAEGPVRFRPTAGLEIMNVFVRELKPKE